MPAHSSRLIFFAHLFIDLYPWRSHCTNTKAFIKFLSEITTAEKTFCYVPVSKTFFIA